MGAVEELRTAVAPIVGDVLGVFLWGSHAERRAHAGSDVDVCIVAGPGVDPSAALSAAWRRAGLVDPRYDVVTFEELPLYLKGEVIERGVLVASRDERGLWEYLRGVRKVWEDQSVRRLGEDEFRRLVEARRARATS